MKGIIIFFVAVIIYAPLSGQNHAGDSLSKIRWGIKLGLAISKINIDDKSGTINSSMINTKPGIIVGGFARIKLAPRASFQPEIRIIGKGWKETGYYAYTATYLEFPLNILYTAGGNKGLFFIGAGPAPAVYLGNNVHYSGYSDLKGFDIGVNTLIGYEIPIGFSLSLHYTHGLANTNAHGSGVSIKNQTFGLSVGYTF